MSQKQPEIQKVHRLISLQDILPYLNMEFYFLFYLLMNFTSLVPHK